MSDVVRLLTLRQLAAYLGQAPDTVRKRAKRGEIPALKVGFGPRSPYRFDPQEIDRWMYGDSRPVRAMVGRDAPDARDRGTPSVVQSRPFARAGLKEER
jgi:excisionase family DNA binding protein